LAACAKRVDRAIVSARQIDAAALRKGKRRKLANSRLCDK
jgi:hypothetical protein